jgi:hypothetical protein
MLLLKRLPPGLDGRNAEEGASFGRPLSTFTPEAEESLGFNVSPVPLHVLCLIESPSEQLLPSREPGGDTYARADEGNAAAGGECGDEIVPIAGSRRRQTSCEGVVLTTIKV